MSTSTMVIGLECRQRCIVRLANDMRAERVHPELVRALHGETSMPWNWE